MTTELNLITTLRDSLKNNHTIQFIGSEANLHVLTASQLEHDALCLLGSFQKSGIRKGDEVVFLIADPALFVPHLWACILGGFIPVPLDPSHNSEAHRKLQNALKQLKNPWVVLEKELGKSSIEMEASRLLFTANTSKHKTPGTEAKVAANDIALIQYSSGSTGTPKGVALTHKNLLSNVFAIQKAADLLADDITLGWMPLTHDLGLIGFHLVPLLCGNDQILMPTSLFVRRPSLWLEKVAEHKVTFTASPNFGYRHFLNYYDPEKFENDSFAHVKRILNGAEPISLSVVGQFLETLAGKGLKREAMFPVYGLAEACLAVTFPETDQKIQAVHIDRNALKSGDQLVVLPPNSQGAISFIKTGRPVADCLLQIVNDADELLSEGHIGHLQIKGENVSSGYYNNPDANATAFTADGWFRTGDLGALIDGELIVTGRAKDIIFSNGRNLYPHDLEQQLIDLKLVEQGQVLACGVPDAQLGRDLILVFVQDRRSLNEFLLLEKQLRQVFATEMAVEVDHILPIRSIQKTTSGKLKRHFYVGEFEQGKFTAAIAEIQVIKGKSNSALLEFQNEKEQQLYQLWKEILQNEAPSNHFFEAGGNSLLAGMLCGKIWKQFNTTCSVVDIFKHPTIQEQAVLIVGKKETVYTPISRVAIQEHSPLSGAQERLFVLHQMAPQQPVYVISSLFRIEGDFEINRFEKALEKLIAHHAILRTSFPLIDGVPVQKIAPNISIRQAIKVLDFSDFQKEIDPVFELDAPPLFRIKIAEEKAHLFWMRFEIHHLLGDGVSLAQMMRDLLALYEGKNLETNPISYADFVQWHPAFLDSEKVKKQQNYWREHFTETPVISDLPLDYPRQNATKNEGARLFFEVSSRISNQITELCNQLEISPFVFLAGTLQVLLSKYTGSNSHTIGTAAVSKPHPDLDKVAGPFLNTLLLQLHAQDSDSIAELFKKTKEITLSALENQDYPYEKLVHDLIPGSNAPLFNVFLVLQNANDNSFSLEDIQFTEQPTTGTTSKFDLNFLVRQTVHGFQIVLEYDTALFKTKTAENIGYHFVALAAKMVVQPEIQLGEIALNSPSETEKIHQKGTGKVAEIPSKGIWEQFQKIAEAYPENIAAIGLSQQLSYQNLTNSATKIAKGLVAKGVSPGDRIGVLLDQLEALPATFLGILRSNATIVPLDTSMPTDRMAQVAQDASLKAIVSDLEASHLNCPIYSVSLLETLDATLPAPNNQHPAYIIYTSGTTGRPKGVIIGQSSICNYTQWLNSDFNWNPNDAGLLLSSYAFDLGYTILWGSLLNGATLHTGSVSLRKDPDAILAYLLENPVSCLKMTPSQLKALLRSRSKKELAKLTDLRMLFLGGEAIRVNDVEELVAMLPHLRVVNHYGPTEATIGCIAHEIRDLNAFSAQPIIGKPILNSTVRILSESFKTQGVGIKGQIAISGSGLALSYSNLPEETAARFIDLDGQRFYLTGDVGSMTEEGHIRFHGRNDDQIKIRGYRVELREIDRAAEQLPEISSARTTVLEVDQTNELVLYYASDQALDESQLRLTLHRTLPDYMLPTFVVHVSSIPLTANGKVDVKQLPSPLKSVVSNQNEDFNSLEKSLAEIWSDILKKPIEQKNVSFFLLGGHSLHATILTAKIHEKLGVEMPLREVFIHTTIAAQADFIQNAKNSTFQHIPKAEKATLYPLSPAQKRMFIMHALEGQNTSYNMPGAFRLEGEIDERKLQTAFNQLIERHDALRTSFQMQSGLPFQKIAEATSFAFERFDLTDFENIDACIAAFVRPFELTSAPLMRAALVSGTEKEHYLLFDIHHIVSDGSSMGLMIKDFVALYDEKPLQPLSIQYTDYSAWLEKRMDAPEMNIHADYWMQQFGDLPEALEIPADFKRPAVNDFKGERFEFEMDAELTKLIKNWCSASGSTLFMVLLASYTALLRKYTRQEDLVVGTPVAGRTHADLQNVLGVFLNMLPIRIKTDGGLTFADFQKEVNQHCINAFEHQEMPFELIVEQLELERAMNRNPLFDTMLVVQNMDLDELRTTDLTFTPHPFDQGTSQLDLSFIVFEQNSTLLFTAEYSTKLFKKETIEKLVNHWKRLISGLLTQPKLPLFKHSLVDQNEFDVLKKRLPETRELSEKTLLELLEKSFVQNENRIALRHGNASLTYAELDQQSRKIAADLLQKGAQPGDTAAILLPNTMERLVVLVGIVRTGITFLPLHDDTPTDRLLFMLTDTSSRFLFTREALPNEGFKGEVIVPSEIPVNACDLSDRKLPKTSDTAYVIYTSGSTGQPKGVCISQASFLDYIQTVNQKLDVQPSDCAVHQFSIAFDKSLEEIWTMLLAGGSIRCADPKQPEEFRNALAAEDVTILSCAPMLIDLFGDEIAASPNMRAVVPGGDVLKPHHIRKIPDHIDLWNSYGPTEATVTISWHLAKRADLPVPIGKPLTNRAVYVLDQDLQVLPDGVPGELCVAGPGLAIGYLGLPELTEKAFVYPGFDDQRYYRTGDKVRWNSKNELLFEGRLDAQLKIRGYRVETDSIAHHLTAHPAIETAVVQGRKDEKDQWVLCAWYVSEKELSLDALRTFLQASLPSYMIPAHFVSLAQLPQTRNGKLNLKALPNPQTPSDSEKIIVPANELETILKALWEDVLNHNPISTDVSFFSIGGDSIKAIQIASLLREKNYHLEVKDVFTYSTIQTLAPHLQKLDDSDILEEDSQGAFPLTPIQHEFFLSKPSNPNHYFQSIVLENTEGWEHEKLADAFHKMVKKHPVLQTRFQQKDGIWLSETNSFDNRFLNIELQHIKESVSTLKSMTESLQNIHIESGKLLAGIHFTGDTSDHLFIAIHHLVIDAVSWPILVGDLQAFYLGEAESKPTLLGTSFQQWSNRLSNFATSDAILSDLDWWQEELQNLQQTAPLFQSNEAGRFSDRAEIEFEIDAEQTTNLLASNEKYGTRTLELIVTALATAIYDQKGNDACAIWLESHGRESIGKAMDISQTIGWFTALYPVQIEIIPNLMETNIIATKDKLRRVPSNGLTYGVLQHLSPKDIKERLPSDPQKDVLLNFLGETDHISNENLKLSDWEMPARMDFNHPISHVLEINAQIIGQKLQGRFSFNGRVVAKHEIEHLIQLFIEKITAIADSVSPSSTISTASDMSFDIGGEDFESIFSDD